MQDFLQGEEEYPYQARQDLAYEQKKKERAREMENQSKLLHEKRLRQQQFKSHFSKPQSPNHLGQLQKHVNFHEVASVGTSTADFGNDFPTQATYNYNNKHDAFVETIDRTSEQSFKLPNISSTPQVANSKSMKLLKPIQQRAAQKSSMDYGVFGGMTRGQSQTQLLKLPNPILGESEGESRRKVINDQYKEYLRKSMERSRENSLTKSAKKRQELLSSHLNSSPKEPNIYAQKQRYKHSYFNFIKDKEQSKKAIEEMLYEPLQDFHTQSNNYKQQSMNFENVDAHYATLPENSGQGLQFQYDDMSYLKRQELQKQQYLRDLKEQMAQNESKKANEISKFKQMDKKIAQEMQNYNPFGKEGAGAPLRDSEGRILAERQGYFAESRTVLPQRDLMAQIQLLRRQSRQSQRKQDDNEIKNVFVDDYEKEVQIREKQKEEWKQNLEQQIKEQERAKVEAVKKKKAEDERDEKRIHEQLREINEEFQKEKIAKEQLMGEQSEYQTKEDPRDLKRLSKKSVIENFVSPERQKKLTNKHMSDIDLNDQYDSNQKLQPSKYLGNMRLRDERDHQDTMIQKSLRNLRLEANRQQQATNLAVDKLSRLQGEIQMKQRQFDIQNQDFFTNIMQQNRAMMSSLKYIQPLNEALSSSSKIYLTPSKNQSSPFSRLHNSRSEFVLPKPKPSEYDTTKAIPKHYPERIQSNLRATQDLEELLHRFQS